MSAPAHIPTLDKLRAALLERPASTGCDSCGLKDWQETLDDERAAHRLMAMHYTRQDISPVERGVCPKHKDKGGNSLPHVFLYRGSYYRDGVLIGNYVCKYCGVRSVLAGGSGPSACAAPKEERDG